MLLGSSSVLNAIHPSYVSKQIRLTAKIDGEPYFMLDF